VILGDNELDANAATLRDLATGTQSQVALEKLAEALETYR
jgi:histidyl-tRNA synthetase